MVTMRKKHHLYNVSSKKECITLQAGTALGSRPRFVLARPLSDLLALYWGFGLAWSVTIKGVQKNNFSVLFQSGF